MVDPVANIAREVVAGLEQRKTVEDAFEALRFESLITCVEINFTIKEPNGLHMRPSTEIVKAVRDLDCEVIVSVEGKESPSSIPRQARGNKLTELISLCVEHGEQVNVLMTGREVVTAVERLAACAHWSPTGYKEHRKVSQSVGSIAS